METLEAIFTRRSTRKFKKESVNDEKLQKIIEAGRYAPSGGNNQTCHFLVMRSVEVLERIVKMAETSFANMEADENTYASLKAAISKAKKGGYDFTYGAPVLISVANRKDYGNNMADSVCAVENMMIAANALDLGSCYINQLRWLNEDPDILAYLKTLGLREDERVYASVALGTADTSDGMPERDPLTRKGNEVTFV